MNRATRVFSGWWFVISIPNFLTNLLLSSLKSATLHDDVSEENGNWISRTRHAFLELRTLGRSNLQVRYDWERPAE